MTLTIPPIDDLVSESLFASLLVAVLAIAGEGNGTAAIVIIGVIQVIDLPTLIGVVCEEAREGC